MNAITRSLSRSHLALLGVAIAWAVGSTGAHAQPTDHSTMPMPPPTDAAPAKKPASDDKPMPQKPAQPMDHAAMGHDRPAPEPATPAEAKDHSAMGHEMPMPQEPAPPTDHSAMGHDTPSDQPREPIPPLTDADRRAAFPDVGGHPVHDNSIQKYVLFDQLEAWNANEGSGLAWEALGWVGTDLNRLWLRSEGERLDGATESADVEALYGRSIARWWDMVAGVRHDFGEGPSRTFAALGVIGVAPYKYELEATLYIGESGQTAARLEAEYDTLLTNRLILQSFIEADLYGQDDERRGIGSGLSTAEVGLRLRYEFTRKFAPYIGVAWERAYAGTADFRRDEDEDVDDTRFVAGLRTWF